MFRPRHAYKSPITSRYRGKAKGCPVFNNIVDINSTMVEQHDECLECLAKIKNRTDLYRTLADNNKPSNNVIKSLQRLSSSASNNRLKTCLQFLIIKVNEKSILTPTPPQHTTTTDGICSNDDSSPKSNEIKEIITQQADRTTAPNMTLKHHQQNKRQRLHNQLQKQKQLQLQKPKHNHLASPPQDQVSSTQDQVGPTQDDHDCQTSLVSSVTTGLDDDPIQDKQLEDSPSSKSVDDGSDSPQLQSSPNQNYALTTTATTTTNTSPIHRTNLTDDPTSSSVKRELSDDIQNRQNDSKRRKIHNSSDHDTSSTASWSSSYASPHSPISTSSTSSLSSSSSRSSSGSSSCPSSSSLSPSPSPSPISSPDIVNELKGPRLKLSEEKIRKIKRRPIIFDDYYTEQSFASTPTTSSGFSPGQHSNTTQSSDHSRMGLSTSSLVIHMFQAPPQFVNSLKPCNLPTKTQDTSPSITPPAPMKEKLRCAICGVRDQNISKIYGQNSCLLCARFFASFLKRPQQHYCSQDGDCLMTFDSRCQACWIKICLQKFDIEEDYRKIGLKYSPKLLSSPNVSLITIDTSVSR